MQVLEEYARREPVVDPPPAPFVPSNSARTTWGAGNYPAMADRLLPAARVLISLIDPRPGEHLVDVACGSGNLAILAAKRGARVVGIDFEPALLEVASARAIEAGLDIQWVEADVDAGFPDEQFDVVASVFGVMYVPDQAKAAHTLVSLCRPGGVVGLAAWAPNSLMSAMGRTLAPYLPPPPSSGFPPARWGDERALSSMFEQEKIYSIANVRRELKLVFDDVQQGRDFLLETAGHVVAERARLQTEGRWEDLLTEMYSFVRDNNCTPGNDVVLSVDYLVSIIHKPDGQPLF